MTKKLIGADAEFSNYISGRSGDTCPEAVQLLLRAIPGTMSRNPIWAGPVDLDRRWLPNGGCCYRDSEHIEFASAETLSAADFLYQWRAILLRLERAAAAVNRTLPAGQRLRVGANNSDGLGNSWGSHMNVLVARRTFESIMESPRWFASFLVSSLIFSGKGKVGSEGGAPPCRFQLCERADHFPELIGANTMVRRGLVNTRDESHAGPGQARLHVIYPGCSTLCDTATYLKAGTLQLVLAAYEAGHAACAALMEDAVEAGPAISHSLGRAPVRMADGAAATALDVQRRFFDAAASFVATGEAEEAVPEANVILAAWGEILDSLRAGDMRLLSRRLDWVAKLSLIGSAVTAGQFTWESPTAKLVDHRYACLDGDGLFLWLERQGRIDRLTDPQRVAACLEAPPEDTRAYARARLLKLAGKRVTDVDWERIQFEFPGAPRPRMFYMSNPVFWNRKNTEQAFTGNLGESLDNLEALAPKSRYSKETNHEYQTHHD